MFDVIIAILLLIALIVLYGVVLLVTWGVIRFLFGSEPKGIHYVISYILKIAALFAGLPITGEIVSKIMEFFKKVKRKSGSLPMAAQKRFNEIMKYAEEHPVP